MYGSGAVFQVVQIKVKQQELSMSMSIIDSDGKQYSGAVCTHLTN